MKLFTKSTLTMAALLTAASSYAGNLWVIGDATAHGWSLDEMTALQSTEATPDLYTGTLYLKADAEFKFLTTDDWGGLEYGAAAGATITDDTVALADGTNDDGYDKLKVAESANYYVEVNTADLTATIKKSVYQETEINLCALYLIGDATPGGWAVDQGTSLFQEVETPYIYKSAVKLTPGSFKIFTYMKGAGSFDPKYFYFRDENDSNKIALGQEGDLQWQIEKESTYAVTVNTLDNSISIVDLPSTVINNIEAASAETEYFTLTGCKVANPECGIFIQKIGNKAQKVIIR